MAAVIESWFRQDLQKPVQVHYLDGSLFSNNGNGNRIGVELTNGGEDYTVTGTVSGYAVLADGSTVPCTGAKSGNKASILVPPAAYLPGNIFITIFLTDGTTVTTLAAVSSTVIQARTDNQVSPGSVVTDWTNTINAAMQSVETAAANLGKIVATPYAQLTFPVPLGKYTYYNNNLYRCTTPIASSEDFTAAHWSSALNLGDEVSDLKSAFVNYQENNLPIMLVKDSYVTKAGVITSYNGWDRTDYVPVAKYHSIIVKSSVSSEYNVFFDKNKSKVGDSFTVDTTAKEIPIPENAAYVILSNTASGMANLIATYVEKDTNGINKLNDTFIDNAGYEQLTNWSRNNLYIKTNSTSADISSPTSTTGNVRYLVTSCSPGDLFTITARGGSPSRAFAFIKSDGTIISRAVASISIENLVLIAPALSAYLIVNDTLLTGKVYKGIFKTQPSVESETKNDIHAITGYDVFDGKLIWTAAEYIDKTTGNTDGDSAYKRTDYVPINGEYTKLIITASDAYSYAKDYNAWYDSEKHFISNFSFSSNATIAVIPPSNARYFRLSCNQFINLSVSADYVTIMDKIGIDKTVTTTVLGYDLPDDIADFNVSNDYAEAMKEAIEDWGADYAGDDTKVPFILHTDQHGRLNSSNKGVFDLLNYLVNWNNVSAIFNLGDTVVDHWDDDDTNENPLLRNATLEAALKCVSSIPVDKQINVFGNHDTWYSGEEQTAVTHVLPSLKYNNPYFIPSGLRTIKHPDNSGLMCVYDDRRMIRYLVVADWDYASRGTPNYQYYYVSKEHWEWIIAELTKDTGYDLVIVSHVPLLLGSSIAKNPITGASATQTTVEKFITQTTTFDNVWTDRKNKSSGTLNVGGQTVSYDFTNCKDNCLCALSGHWHDDVVDYCKGTTGLLTATFDWFADRTIHFGIIDRANSQIKVWKLHNESNTPGVQTWTAPFSYTE